tara:strand:- start:591 stop:2378 length:1788 start_codon:yes stop_codon:yes gene_type:complete
MENSDRVIELNNEALIESGAVMSETGEATGYLETLVESNTVALDRQRASLERTAAMWGDVFIPGQIEGIAIQEEVYKLLLNIVNAHGKLGGALSGLVRFKTVIETTYAPMLSALINVKAMTIAMATQKALMRALSGEQLAYANKQQANADMAQIDSDQAIADIMAEIDALEAKRNQQIENSTTNMQISERNDMLANEELLNLKAIKQEIITGGAIKTKIASKDKLIGDYVTNNKQKELLLTQATTAKYDAESIAKGNNMIETRQLQESINQEKNTRQQVIAQIEILIQNLKEFIITNDQYRLSVQEGTMSTEEYEMALFELNLKLQQVEGTTERTKHSFSGMNMVMMKMSMASMGVHMGMSLLSPILFKNKDAAEKARLEMAAMTVTSVIMGIEMLVSMSHMMKNTAAMTGQGAAAGFSAMMNKQLSRALIAVGFSAKTATIWSARLMTVLSLGVMVAVIAGAIWALDKLLKKYDDIGDSAADAAGAVEDLNTSFATNVADAEYTISPDIDFSAATASMQEFAGAREEMFFGFKAGRVTGDMIKQVQQGGIETFISNTEVIMTNNFNGMTTEEVAEQILDEIERGGRARGMAIGA